MSEGREIDEKTLDGAAGGASVPNAAGGTAQSEQLYRCRNCRFEKKFKRMIGARWACPACGGVMERVRE